MSNIGPEPPSPATNRICVLSCAIDSSGGTKYTVPASADCPASASATGSCAARPICLTSRRSEEHTSELQSLMRISYAVFCLKKKKYSRKQTTIRTIYSFKINHSDKRLL